MNFDSVFSLKNIYRSGKKCCNGVRWKTSTQNFETQLLRNIVILRKQVLNGKYKSKGFYRFTIKERGKARKIEAVHISERTVQKCLCDYCLIPTLTCTFIYDNGACIKGKGVHFATKRLKTHLHRYVLTSGVGGGYVLLFDIKDFFNSIDHKILLSMAQQKITDDRLFGLYAYFINCFDGSKGLGLGSQVSQISALFYLNKLDHYIKDIRKCKYYGRYMDDGYIVSNSKSELIDILDNIRRILGELGLRLNESKTQILKIENGFTFLKRRYLVYDNLHISVRPNKANILRYKRKYKKLCKKNTSIARELTKSFIGYLKEFNYYDRYTDALKGVELCNLS